MLETIGGGLAVVDFDLDGLEDLCLSAGGTIEEDRLLPHAITLLRQTHRHQFCKVTDSGIGANQIFSHGVAAPDVDDDGFADFIISGFGGIELFLNRGDGTFEACHWNAFPDIPSDWFVAAAWGDLNQDSTCDLYVTGYLDWSLRNHPKCTSKDQKREICAPREFRGIPDLMLFGCGDGSFRLPAPEHRLCSEGKGLGVSILDLDADHDLDVYVANDGEANFLLENTGHQTFRDVAVYGGAGLNAEGAADGSMGVAVLDDNFDGRPDLLVSNYELETNALYMNQGNLEFLHSSRQSGLASVGRQFVCWGIVTDDLDCDGDQDVVLSNGHVLKSPASGKVMQPPIVLEKTDQFGLVDVSQRASVFTAESHHGRAVVGADLDVDGDRDLIFLRNDSPAVVLTNSLPTGNARWIAVQLTGRHGTRDPIGARVSLLTSHGEQHRFAYAGEGFASSGSRWLHFGVPREAHSLELEVAWPSGKVDRFALKGTNRRLFWIESRPPLEMPQAHHKMR